MIKAEFLTLGKGKGIKYQEN